MKNIKENVLQPATPKTGIITAATKRSNKQFVAAFYRRIPAMERLASVNSELTRYMSPPDASKAVESSLPDYCYHIFEKFRRTYFKEYPNISETITGNIEGLSACQDVEQAKRLVKIDWLRLGKLFGIGLRGKRFVEMEAEPSLTCDGMIGRAANDEELSLIIDGAKLPKDLDGSCIRDVGTILEKTLKDNSASHLDKLAGGLERFGRLAYLWGSDALADFNRGLAAGLNGFMDEDGQLTGETPRANLYWFLLLAWPEIKPMLESEPKKTMTDLHDWMLPFMRHGITSLSDVETLRDVCAPPPSGIGLSLRPLKNRSSRASA
jgi:hypothetical protein